MALKVNGEYIRLVDSPVSNALTTDSFELEGESTAELRLTELDQTDPAGRWRFRLTGDALQLERAAQASWVDSNVFLKVTSEGVDLVNLSDDGVADLLERVLLNLEQGGGGIGILTKQIVEMALLL